MRQFTAPASRSRALDPQVAREFGTVGVPSEDVILGNSTSYGLNVLAQDLPVDAGDELLLVEGDYPATVYPWLPLREHGVRLRMVQPHGGALTNEALAAELTDATRLDHP